jgi:soluble lytic murein transglycosylase-like protein
MSCLWLVFALLIPLQASAFCFQEAGQRYRVDPVLLEAISIKESSLQPRAVNVNRDALGNVLSTDYGLMQINTRHAKRLMSMGIIKRPEDLLGNACFNVQVGAWVLAQHLRVCGNTWRCLGSYNAGFAPSERQEQRRLHYAHDVRQVYDGLKALGAAPARLAIR